MGNRPWAELKTKNENDRTFDVSMRHQLSQA